MAKNNGALFEEEVYNIISEIVKENRFMVSFPNVRILRKPRYYSKDRDAEIEFDISVEKYLGNPDENENMRPSIIIIIECKDYSSSIPIDDVEEFHAKLQQIGADNTKGMIITKTGDFQRSALTYAKSKGIALASIFPPPQVRYVLYSMGIHSCKEEIMRRERILEKLIVQLFDIDYFEYLSHEIEGNNA